MRGKQLLLMHAVFSSLRNSISGMGHIKNSKRGVAYKIRRQNFPRLNDVFNCTYSFGCTSACACITLYNTLKQFCSKKGRSKKSKPTGQGEKQQNSAAQIFFVYNTYAQQTWSTLKTTNCLTIESFPTKIPLIFRRIFRSVLREGQI